MGNTSDARVAHVLRRCALAPDPAMLLYLDLSWSTSEAPNENFARELMELFTIGPGNYTEEDVQAGALAPDGYVVDYETGKVDQGSQELTRR